MLNQPFLVSAHAKKIVGLFDDVGLCLMIGALAVHQLFFRVKAFAPKTIKPLIFTEVNIVFFLDQTQNISHRFLVIRIRCSNKGIVGNIQFGPEILKHAADAIHVLFRGLAGGFCGSNNLVSMLIGTREKKGLLSGEFVEAVQYINYNGRVGMTDVRLCIHIVYGCCNIEFF